MDTQFQIDDEREINVKDLLFRVLLQWRSILIYMLVFSVLAGGFSFIKNADRARKNQMLLDEELQFQSAQDKEKISNQKKEAAKKNLSSSEIANVEHVAGIVNEYQQMYDIQKKYNDESIYMKIDATVVHTVTLQYYIDNHFQIEYPIMAASNDITAIIKTYQSKLKSENLYQEIASRYEEEIDPAYFNEVISVDIGGAGNGIFEVTMYGYNEEVVQSMAKCVKEAVEAIKGEVNTGFSEYDISLTDESYLVRSDAGVLANQQNNTQRLNTLNESIVKLEAALSEDELKYLAALLESENIHVDTEEEVDEKTDGSPLEDGIAETSSKIDLRYIVLGLAAGAMLVIAGVGIQYIFDNKLKTEEEIEDYFRIQKLGLLAEDEELDVRNPIDRWIINWRDRGKRRFSVEESLQIIQAGIRVTAQKHELHHIFITGCDITEMEIEIISKLKELLSDTGLDIRHGNNAIYHPEALMELADADGVVLIERTGESTYDEIKKEIELCCMHKTMVIGAVVVK